MQSLIAYWPLAVQIVLGLTAILYVWIYLPLLWGALWLPTPRRIVDKMLRLADVQPGQKVVDLGAGDGRIVIAAARSFKARSVGVEIDPLRCLLANTRIHLLGLRDRAHVYYGNMYDLDLRDADVVTLYLWPETNERLKARLLEQMRPQARVVTYRFSMVGWIPLRPQDGDGIYLYEISSAEPDIWAALTRKVTS